MTVKSAGASLISAEDKFLTAYSAASLPYNYTILLYSPRNRDLQHVDRRPLPGRRREGPRRAPCGAPGEEGRAAGEYSAELRVKTARVEGK